MTYSMPHTGQVHLIGAVRRRAQRPVPAGDASPPFEPALTALADSPRRSRRPVAGRRSVRHTSRAATATATTPIIPLVTLRSQMATERIESPSAGPPTLCWGSLLQSSATSSATSDSCAALVGMGTCEHAGHRGYGRPPGERPHRHGRCISVILQLAV